MNPVEGRHPSLARFRGLWLASAGIAVCTFGFVGMRRWRSVETPARPGALVATSDDEAVAIACLTLGDASPSFDRLPPEQAESVATMLACVLGSYRRADFALYASWHASEDIAFAADVRRARIQELRDLSLGLDRSESDIPNDWMGALGAFWSEYYDAPPIARVAPESAYFRLTSGALEIDAWESSFDELRDALAPPYIEHDLAIPHRRRVDRMREEDGMLTWMDFSIRFDTPEGQTSRLLSRFVWDPIDEMWFLHRAVTAHSKRFEMVSDRRNLIL